MMKTRDDPVLHIARSLLAATEPAELLDRLASLVRDELDAEWAAVWIYERRRKKYSLELSHPEGIATPLPKNAGRKGDLLSETIARKRPVVRRGEEITETILQHLGPTPPAGLREIFCIPFTLDSDRLGLLELTRERVTPDDAHPAQERLLSAVAAMASAAAASMVRLQTGRDSQLAAINRLMQLYDVSQVFHSTLERDDLLPMIADRINVIMDVPFCRIWLASEDGESLVLALPQSEGEPERLQEGDAVPWTAFQSGESVLIPDVQQAETAAQLEEFYGAGEAGSVICAPLIVDETSLGAIEIIQPPGAALFGEDERDFLEELTRQAAVAVRNSNLFLAERKAHELDALLDISREITSTLDLDHVLATIVNRADSLVSAERCAVLLAEGNRLELRAISGHMEIDHKDPHIQDLTGIVSWAHMAGKGLYISELEGHIETDREETREKFRRYFERSEMKSFLAFPLKDEEGLLGTLSLESTEPYFVSEEKLEVFNILVNQATVAIRNATLYRQIPLISLMEPIVGWRTRLKKIPRWIWLRNATYAAVLTLALVLVPWNMKIGGKVVVLPQRNSPVTAEVEGVIDAIHHREGDRVRRGDLLATLIDRDRRIRLKEASSLYEIADREVAQYEAALDRVAARQARTRRNRLREEFSILRQEMGKTRITSPVDGVILTPRLEQKVGTFVGKGQTFCRIADMNDVAVEILVPETEIAEIEEGQAIRLKIDAFPTETISARVEIVGQMVLEEAGARYLIVRGRVDGGGLPLKTGMVGRAKIVVGWRSVGYVLLRKPARFLWRTLWTWLP